MTSSDFLIWKRSSPTYYDGVDVAQLCSFLWVFVSLWLVHNVACVWGVSFLDCHSVFFIVYFTPLWDISSIVIIVCLFMGEHEISIKRIFDFRTSQNETKFEIYCNDKTESNHITENNLKVAINTITWVWTKSLIIHTVIFLGRVNVEKIYCDQLLRLFLFFYY
jgi:hypothetical protein